MLTATQNGSRLWKKIKYKYTQSENKKGKNLFGGMITNTERNYRGRWVYFDKAGKDFKDNSFENWIDLIL